MVIILYNNHIINPTEHYHETTIQYNKWTIEKIGDQLFKRIEELAVKVVKDNDGIADFCMGMGSASFEVDFLEINEDGEEWRVHGDYDLDDGILKWQWKHEAAIKEIFYILDEYNWQFKLTGSPILIKKVNGEITIAYHW